MRIVDNIPALRVHTSLTRTNRAIENHSLRLSSGFRINSAGDDPAGFAISLHMRNQIKGLNMADRNTMDGSSLLETADAAMQDIQNMLHRIRELSVQAANDTYSYDNRQMIQKEIDALLEEVNDITRKVEFNNIGLLNGAAQNLRVQVGGRQGMSINVTIPPIRTWDLGLSVRDWHFAYEYNANTTTYWPVPPNHPNYVEGSSVLHPGFPAYPGGEPAARNNVLSHENAQGMIDAVDVALDRISMVRAEVGAFINRFEYTSSSLQAASEATSRSLSRIFDADMAYEMMHLSKNNVLAQAGMSIMAQLNARPQQVLQLL